MVSDGFNILLMVMLPFLSIKLVKNVPLFSKISPVLLCYGVGIIFANIPDYRVNEPQISKLFEFAVILAIPMLLFNARINDWKNLAGKSLLSFILGVIAVLFSALTFPLLFKDLPNISTLSGMLTGVYVGGTPNMQAVGIALEADHNTFIKLNAAEVASGGIYLLVLASGFQQLVLKVLNPYHSDIHQNEDQAESDVPYTEVKPKYALVNILLSLGLTGLVLLFGKLLYGDLQHPIFIMIGITTISLWASFSHKIHSLPGGYATGEYFLLIFCTGIGLLADFSEMFSGSLDLILFTGGLMVMSILLHIVLCYFFKIDADNMIIGSTATIFGPAFIGQITGILKNKELLVPGMIMSLMGLAIANYLGVMVAKILVNFIL